MSSMSDEADRSRRHFLTVATSVVGGVGVVLAAAPFVASFKPSARAQALGGPVELDIS
jgi:ubiquinol-cytochrome c reductase iron-sulfur subunit